MTETYHPLVKRLLDGELSLNDLPTELRAEGAEALRLLGVVDRAPVSLPARLDARVMAEVRRRVRRWVVVGGALAAAAALALLVARPAAPPAGGRAVLMASRDSVYVRFILYAPDARQVSVAGTFNRWDRDAAPLVRQGATGIWTTTVALPVGQHQYAFVVDGARWVADPAAPGIDDGFGRRNSVVAVTAQGARTL